MNTEQLRKIISQHLDAATVSVAGDNGKFEATVISDAFRLLSAIQRHRMVYAAVRSHIADGTVHALSIRAYTVAEFRQRGN